MSWLTPGMQGLLLEAAGETAAMVGLSALIAVCAGLPLGLLLFLGGRRAGGVVGTSIGTGAATVPLAIAATAFVSRLFETAFRGVDPGLLEAAEAMGATRGQIVRGVLLREAAPGLVAAVTVMLVSLVGFSAMAGAVGGGGLGDLGIRFGYQRFMPAVMVTVVVLLVVVVQTLQSLGDLLVRRLSHR